MTRKKRVVRNQMPSREQLNRIAESAIYSRPHGVNLKRRKPRGKRGLR